jgi:GNAT superfamily N-acetyltransferase
VSDVEIKLTRFGAPAAQRMVAAAQADLTARYGGGDDNPVHPVEFDPPVGCFLVAYRDGEPVACGGWRRLAQVASDDVEVADDVAELKRVYADPVVRGTGVAAAILQALEDSARERGMRRVVLETGLAQPEAIAFYRKHGYVQIPNYGYYRDYPDCVSFARDLV